MESLMTSTSGIVHDINEIALISYQLFGFITRNSVIWRQIFSEQSERRTMFELPFF